MSGVVNAHHAGEHASTGSTVRTRRRTVRIWPLQLPRPLPLKLPRLPVQQSSRPARPHTICGGISDAETGDRNPARLPSDLINAIADAVVGDVAVVTDECCSALRRLGVAPAMGDEAQTALRKLSHVCHDWRRTLLSRAWRSVALTGAPGLLPGAHGMHTFAASTAQRLVVPWGAMAAPVPWSVSSVDDGDDMGPEIDASADANMEPDGCSSTSSTSSIRSIGYSVDSASPLHLPIPGKTAAMSLTSSTSRLRSVFGNHSWPAVEHLDMSFMPLICYQGFAAHVQHTMPNLRTLRIGGFVPAAALADVLLLAHMPLEAIEIAGSVWADSTAGRRRSSASSSASSWRSSTTTVAVPDPSVPDWQRSLVGHGAGAGAGVVAQPALARTSAAPPTQSLALLAVTADALRSPAVFAFAMTQAPTLRVLHLLECDYKIIDMLRCGRLEERHMHAVEWNVSQPMVLHSQQQVRQQRQSSMQLQTTCWASLKHLHIERYYMAPRENAGLHVYADCMPALEELTVGHMEPSDSRLPLALPSDAALAPCLRGLFPKLVQIRAPVFDIRSLPALAPALRSLCITRTGSSLSEAIAPSSQDIDALMASDLPLKSVVVAGKNFLQSV